MEGFEYKLDELDLAILGEMEFDGRQSISDLARKLGTSRAHASRRLQRLLDRKITRITAFTNPLVLGYQVFAMIGIRVMPSEIHVTADEVGTLPNVHLVAIAAGRNDILIWTMFQTQADLSLFLGRGLGSIPSITSVETMIVLETRKMSFSHLAASDLKLMETRSENEERPIQRASQDEVTIDHADLMILKEMETDGRQSVSDLAKKIGASRAYTGNKLQRLLDRRYTRVVATTNPLALGYRMFAMIGIKLAPSQIDAAVDKLAALRDVHVVWRSTGRYDIIMWTMFRTPPDLSNFLVKDLGSIPGITSTETTIGLELRKMSLQYLASSHMREAKTGS